MNTGQYIDDHVYFVCEEQVITTAAAAADRDDDDNDDDDDDDGEVGLEVLSTDASDNASSARHNTVTRISPHSTTTTSSQGCRCRGMGPIGRARAVAQS